MDKKKTIHFIGIGGAGMSGIAEVFYRCGYSVQGSDIKETKVTNRLKSLGIRVNEFHAAENIKGSDYVVYSSCIGDENPEFKEAKDKGIKIVRRIEALNMLMGDKKVIAVSGAHGKTTTTSLISYLLIKSGLDPTVFIGADVSFLDGNAHFGQGEIAVTEADESDGSFLHLKPFYSVSTNIDMEHMDYYATMDEIMMSYRKFIENTREDGRAFICADDSLLEEITRNSPKKITRYGISRGSDVRAEKIELMGLNGSRFDLVIGNKTLGNVSLPIMGLHNILNSLAAIAVAMDLGVDFSLIQDVIKDFKGAERRFKITNIGSDIIVIDDYAHHPTEIKATLKILENSDRRIIAVFQPHRYSRTKYLREQFGRCFDLVDYLIITDIYSAYENPIDGVSALDLCENTRRCGHKNVHFVSKDDIIKHLVDVVRPKDAVFILGAGDIGEMPDKIVKALKGAHSGNAKM
ncbi:MAG: UDP-N-acetylmuramate--L-alanine ligase [Candidatus Omnitrophota bacterium]